MTKPTPKPRSSANMPPPPMKKTRVVKKSLVLQMLLTKLEASKTADWHALSLRLSPSSGNSKTEAKGLSGSDLHELYHNFVLPGLKAGRALWEEGEGRDVEAEEGGNAEHDDEMEKKPPVGLPAATGAVAKEKDASESKGGKGRSPTSNRKRKMSVGTASPSGSGCDPKTGDGDLEDGKEGAQPQTEGGPGVHKKVIQLSSPATSSRHIPPPTDDTEAKPASRRSTRARRHIIHIQEIDGSDDETGAERSSSEVRSGSTVPASQPQGTSPPSKADGEPSALHDSNLAQASTRKAAPGSRAAHNTDAAFDSPHAITKPLRKRKIDPFGFDDPSPSPSAVSKPSPKCKPKTPAKSNLAAPRRRGAQA
ncbi:hypothetical protein CC85DRAFT_319557 [Cutaneotrichosporon oleaginosum]|uniref:Uncharacterized protein n=1 Tax=Cutaneotrichosporon oleaginosum TaxID=879819 RepID=A0A0J0XKY0_9TREE|nr:uncharacterized protein CC85DRAFT_319557 [Cutaneotrichosporon oleaginosum]KLT41756.1 hypothetical protein CC85DRAFT_319557 [Cutaneotrichosporon oleaginosum]TXT12352.1 hypothetical protein COLE_02762 [Cutaneotrichosporon oleaginosum]